MPQQTFKAFIITLALLLPLWFIYRILVNKNKKLQLRPEGLLLSFLIYLVAVAAVTIIPVQESMKGRFTQSHINLVPIARTIEKYETYQGPGYVLQERDFYINLIGNILLFVPLGLMLPLFIEQKQLLKKVLLIALIGSCLIEFVQYLSFSLHVYRFVDIDDVILNVLGAALGYWAYKALPKKKAIATQ